MTPLKHLQSTTTVLTERNIDTDQIVPARFLTTTNRLGLGQAAFADWRFDNEGRKRADCPLNAPEVEHSEILIAGENFGCGSSREHAVWALLQFGFRVVISSRIADIFRANALRNGLLAIEVDEDAHAWLTVRPGARLGVDIDNCRLQLLDGREVAFDLDPFARTCLMEGVDTLGYLLGQEQAIAGFEQGSREAA